MLASLLENTAGDLALLVAASVYRLVICTPCLAKIMAQCNRFACTLRSVVIPYGTAAIRQGKHGKQPQHK